MKIPIRSQVLAVEMAKWVAPTDEHEARLAAAQRTLELVEMYEDDVRAAIAAGLARDKSLLGVAGADTPSAPPDRVSGGPAPAGHVASAVAALAAAFPDAEMTVRPLAPSSEDLSDQPPAARAGRLREAAVGAGNEEDPSP